MKFHNTPSSIVAKLNHVMVEVLNDPNVRPLIEKQGYRPGGTSPEVFGRFVRAEVEKFARVVKEAGIKPEAERQTP